MPPPDPRDSALLTLARTGGGLLAGVVQGLTALRPNDKPLHPLGEVRHGLLARTGQRPETGVPWLDEVGDDEVLLRWSRAVGLPAPLPDIHGLALRVPLEGGRCADLLFATTGWSTPLRPLLLARLNHSAPMTTLLPYTTPRGGSVVLGARPHGEGRTTLYVASPVGAWRAFAELTESDEPAVDEPISFDPVLNHLPDLPFPAWVSRLREPAYWVARQSRHLEGSDPA